MATEFHGYGERGMVNALVHEVVVRDLGPELIASIQWASDDFPNWTRSMRNVDILVESGMAEFGCPDLIVTAETEQHERHVLFIEAKANGYVFSSMPNSLGMISGFNSSINGQLSLRYRCSHALHSLQPQAIDLVEPEWLHQAYARPVADLGLADPCPRPRHVQKSKVLDLVRKLSLPQLPLTSYHFVALTVDDLPFWQTIPTGRESEFLPRVLGEAGQDHWPELRGQFGWLGWSALERALNLGRRYKTAAATMEPNVPFVPRQAVPDFPLLDNPNWDDLAEWSLALRDALENSARGFFGPNSVVRRDGSSSVYLPRPDNRRLVDLKITPYFVDGECFFGLGIHAVRFTPEHWCPYDLDGPYLVGVRQPQPFAIVRLVGNQAESVARAEELFRLIATDLDVFLG